MLAAVSLIVAFLAMALDVPLGTPLAQAADLLVENARLIDGTGSPPRDRVSILIRNGEISEIGPGLTADAVPVIDAAGATVLPGLIDAHVHFIAAPGGAYRNDSPATLRELNRQHLRAYLACGVTTVLDAGTTPEIARDIHAWLAAGHAGPRFLTTGPYIRARGGYGAERFGSESTPAEVEAKLDLIQSLGGSGVKLGFGGWSPFGGPASFSAELRRTIVASAARRHLPLYAHALTEDAQREALDWGAHAIMHAASGGRWTGEFFGAHDLSTEFVQRMKASGAYQLTTFSILDNWPGLFAVARVDDPLVRLTVPDIELATARDPGALAQFAKGVIGFATPWVPERVRPLLGRRLWTRRNLRDGLHYSQRSIRRLYHAGVPIVVGTDAPSPWPDAFQHFHGPSTLREIELVGHAGLPPMAAIMAATRVPAEMLGIAAQTGTVEVGKRGDLLIVRDDPLKDLRALRGILWTVKDGAANTPAAWMSRAD